MLPEEWMIGKEGRGEVEKKRGGERNGKTGNRNKELSVFVLV